MPYKKANPDREFKYVKDISEKFLRTKIQEAKNMTQLVYLLGFSDGDTTRVKLKGLIDVFGINISHFRSRPCVSSQIKLERRLRSNIRASLKLKEQRKNLERQEHFIFHDTRQSDKKKGLLNDLTKAFIRDQIERGCQYCGNDDCKMGLDRIDNALGHLKTNVIPSCSRCNLIRGSMPFAAWQNIVPSIKDTYEKELFKNWLPGNRGPARLTNATQVLTGEAGVLVYKV